MYRFHAAYEHQNGDVEGFIGYGFSPTSAEEDCIRQIRAKVNFGTPHFERGRVIRKATKLTQEQRLTVFRDWADILRAKREAGHSVI